MALSRIPLTPGMDATTMISAINQNFQQIESENRTKIIRDEDGMKRILMGRAPDGRYLLAITAPNVDVVEALDGS